MWETDQQLGIKTILELVEKFWCSLQQQIYSSRIKKPIHWGKGNYSSGWWVGTFLFFHSVGNVIIPTDFHPIIFQRGRSTTNQMKLSNVSKANIDPWSTIPNCSTFMLIFYDLDFHQNRVVLIKIIALLTIRLYNSMIWIIYWAET